MKRFQIDPRGVLVGSLILGLAACATPRAERVNVTHLEGPAAEAIANADQDVGYYCHQETISGSHRTRMVCRTPGRKEQDRQAAQDILWDRQNAHIDPPKDGGG